MDNDIVQETAYDNVVTKVDNTNTTGFALETKYDKSDLKK